MRTWTTKRVVSPHFQSLSKGAKALSENTIKDKVWAELDKNPLLLPRQLCAILQLNYKDYGNYVTFLRSKWKEYTKDKRLLKGLTFHNWHGWIYVPRSVDRGLAVGWVRTRAKNRYLLWKDAKLGRLEWFETGRVKVWVKKPASLGRAYQLLADAFFKTALMFDIRTFEPFLKSLRFKGAHAVYDTGERLPYAKIDFLRLSNGVVIKIGDRTHPTGIEVEFCYPDWGEKNEKILNEIMKSLKELRSPPHIPEEKDVPYRI